MLYIQELEQALMAAAKPYNIVPMQNYMKNHFEFYGVRSPERRALFTSFVKQYGIPYKNEYQEIVLKMMQHPKREMHYCAIDLAIKCQKKYSDASDEPFIRALISTHSWWDSVDSIAPNILGNHLKKYPEQIIPVLESYKKTDNMWLHRSCILFQLKYKKETNETLLFETCLHFTGSKEFFINKAIGWALREYAKTNHTVVYAFVETTPLSNLSTKEALKHKK